ncbi:MAG: LysR family transcriptional regulator [Archangiaceae bacterium]|nr:LysR family transcriptional regulator [Archangiaceae bacterium]
MLPPLDSLRCFVEGARLLNFRAAARVVALTPAALGQRIKQLEDLVGRPLFTRTSRKVVLTEAGLSFLPYARDALTAAERCLQAGRGELGPVPQELVLGTRHELGMSWLVPMLPRLRKAHPGITFHVYFGAGNDLLVRVRAMDVHCAVGSMRAAGDPLIATLPLHLERYLLVGAPRLLRELPVRSAEDVGRHALIDVNLGLPLFGYLRDAEGGSAFRFKQVVAMGTIAAVRELVLWGEGLAVLPEYLVAPDLAARRLQRVLPRHPVLEDWFRLYFREDDPRRALYESFAQTLRTQAP